MSVYVPPATDSGSSCTGGCGSIDDNKVSEVASFGQREEGEELFDVLTHKAPPTQRNYLSQYFAAHMLSKPSWRYMYLLYIVVGLFTIIAAALHHFRVGHGSYLGAVWTKWAMKNRVVKLGRKERQKESIASPTSSNAAARLLGRLHAQPKEGQLRPPPRRKTITFPSLGRILLLWALVTIPVLLTLIGADYVRPSASTFDLSASFSNITSPNQSLTIIYRRHLQWGIGDFQAITTTVPTVTLPYRTWWTVGGRTGIMINALTPLIVITALKAQPFALLSTRLLGGIAFDRLSYLHKWGGRLVWLFAAVHVVTWSIQLHLDQAYNGEIWLFVFLWNRFRWGFVVSSSSSSICAERACLPLFASTLAVVRLPHVAHTLESRAVAAQLLRGLLRSARCMCHRHHGSSCSASPTARSVDAGCAGVVGAGAHRARRQDGLAERTWLRGAQASVCRS